MVAGLVAVAPVSAQGELPDVASEQARVIAHWTPERIASAIPRDLVIDEQGLGYLRRPDGSLQPYGQPSAAGASGARTLPTPQARPPSNSDSTPPNISNMVPAAGATIDTAATFSAEVTDASGIKSVSFVIEYPSGATQTFSAGNSSVDTWSINFSGFSAGDWQWRVVAKDNAKRGGNTATSAWIPFSCCGPGDAGDPGGSSDIVTNAEWTTTGDLQTAVGRIYFEMPNNPKHKKWNGYVCSGTVATDGVTGRSIIITAAHCVYDDANKAFARNVLFIPAQHKTTGSRTDLDCSNDFLGCWAPDHGVVDVDWTIRTFPDNIAWDYAYYVVNDVLVDGVPENVLEDVAGSLNISFTLPILRDWTHALGYSYSEDPNLMYCAEEMGTNGPDNLWLPSCGLSGGSSGGPWVQPMTSGSGPIISVNSWGYTTAPGMAGPILSGTSAECVFDAAKFSGGNFAATCPPS